MVDNRCVFHFLEQFVRQLLKFYLYFSRGSNIKDEMEKAPNFRREITVETRLIFDKNKFVIKYFCFFIERIMFAICPESRPRRTDEE